ncbi:MAG: hypothetical protein GX437_12550 [Sphingobacteriales bacterium]|nr:hypothetical protein [Sphingobacteriales bacterium]
MRYFALTTVFILTAIFSMAQNFIKFSEATEINGRKFFKGEIYQQIADKKILFGKDTIDLGKTKTEKVTVENLSQISDKLNFVKNLDSQYQINVTKFINDKDTIKLVKADNNIINFLKKGNALIDIKECGSPFRLIIPGYPSIVFYESEIPKPVVEEPTNTPVDEVVEDEGLFSGLSWWQYLIGGVLILIIIFFLYKIIRRFINKRGKYPIYEKYNGGELNEFAEKMGITRSKLIKYNSDLLGDYENLNRKEKDKLKNNLRGKNLIIGYSSVYSEPSKPYAEDEPFNQKPQTVTETYQQSQNTNELSSQIQRMENRILNKIESLASNKEASQKIENLQKEIESFKGKITLLNKDIEQGNQKMNELNSELTQLQKKKQEIESEYQKYSEKVIFVDYLEPFARATYDYYNFCQKGYIKALEYFQKLNHSDSELVSIVSQLLVKFNSNIPNKTNHWVGVINEIKDSKATANIDLIQSLKQIPNNEEKSKEFKRILLKEVFEKYSSSIFILTEEFSNLSKFTNNSSSVVKDFEQFFTIFKSELHGKSKAIGLDLNYVPLFEHYEKYAAFTKLANQTCSLPYKNIKNIPKDSVLEIINYGFGNEETNVILA